MFLRKYFSPEDDLGSSAGGSDVADTSAAAPANTESAPVDMEVTIRQQLQKMSGRTRDESGRFSANAPAEAPETDAVVEPVENAEAAAQTAVVANANPDNLEFTDNGGQKHAVNIAEPPQSWRADAKAAYAALPENIRREVHKREHDFHSGVQQYKTAANFAVSIGSEFKPYEALMRSQQWTPQALTKDMMNTHYRLSTGDATSKAAEILRVAGLYNVSAQDLQAAVANVQSGATQPAQAPEYIELRRELDQIKNERTQAEEASIQEQIRSFETDGKHEFFKQVAVEMGALMSAGRANSMQDAYDKAIWANPEVRAKLQAKQQAEQQRIAADKAAAARKASSGNVVARGKHPSAAPMGSMEDTIRSAYRKINGAE